MKPALTRHCKTCLSLLFSFTFGLPAYAEISLVDEGGRVRIEYTRQAHQDEEKSTISVQPEFTFRIGETTDLYVKPRLNISPTGDYKEIYDDQFERTDATKTYRFNDYVVVDTFEAYLKTPLGDGNLTIGKQQVAWGTADGLRVLDAVNPVDLTNFIMAEQVDARIPLWMANYQQSLSWTDLQLLVIPDKTHNDYSAEPDWYYLTSPRIIPPPAPAGIKVEQHKLDDGSDNPLKSADYGIRLTNSINGWDMTFNYLYHYDDDLIIRHQIVEQNNEPLILVDPAYERSNLLGGSLTFASGEFVYRSEYAYSSDRYILTKNPNDADGVENRRDFSYVLGVDWSGLNDYFFSAQFFQSILSGTTGYLVRDKVDSNVTLNISRNLSNETWKLEALYLYNLNDRDSALRSRIKYSFDDKTAFYFQYENYRGDINGLFGQFREKDRFLLYMDRYF